uniref:Uncharacterized protein n=1 Tax=Picea glauca TaxID=3330 RepID=A0A124GNZ6_PICGL|nr:hypothetical protein ABT39_MTgene216 [Picea glauca]
MTIDDLMPTCITFICDSNPQYWIGRSFSLPSFIDSILRPLVLTLYAYTIQSLSVG